MGIKRVKHKMQRTYNILILNIEKFDEIYFFFTEQLEICKFVKKNKSKMEINE